MAANKMKCFLLAFCLIAATQVATPAHAQANWPDRPIKLIVPFPAGALTDVVARQVAVKLGERLGQTLVVENRVGGSGNVGSEAVVRAAPDGYTIGLATSTTHTITVALKPNVGYDPIKDLEPISMIGVAPYALVVNPEVPAKSVAEFIALAKSKPKAINYSSVGPASLAHLAGELFSHLAGIQLTHVPYRSQSHAVVDLTAGRIESQFGALGASLPSIREGKLRLLAVTSASRVSMAPEASTVAESGLPGYEATLWVAIVAPAGTPAAIVSRLNKEIVAVIADPVIARALILQAVEPKSSTPAELREQIQRDIVRWRDLGAKAGIKIE